MKLIEYSFILFLILLMSSSAQTTENWQNYTSMISVSQIEATDEGIWAITEGGAFFYNHSDSTFKRLTNSEGLGSQFLTALTIDNSGNIWLGADDGIINVYQPNNGTVEQILDIAGSNIKGKRINELKVFGDTVFVSTEYGLSLVNTKTLAFYDSITKFGDFQTESNVSSATKLDRIYVSTDKGIAVQKEGFENLTAPSAWETVEFDSIPANNIYQLGQSSGNLIAASDNGILELNNSNWNTKYLQGNKVIRIKEYNNSFYAVRPSNNTDALIKLSDNQADTILETTNHEITDLARLDENSIYFSSQNGIISLKNQQTIHPNSPLSNTFLSIEVDGNSNVWVGSGTDVFGKGIFRFDGKSWENYTKENTPVLPTNAYHKVYTAPDNSVYFANWGRGFARFREGDFTAFYHQNTDMVGITDNPDFIVISDLHNDSNNDTWILNFEASNNKVLSVLTKDGIWHHYEFGPPLTPRVVKTSHLEIDQFDTKWFAVRGENQKRGLYYFNDNNTLDNTDDDTWGKLHTTDGLNDNFITELLVDRRGELWIGTPQGINVIFNTSNPNRISNIFALRNQSINCIEVDPLNRKWVGTTEGVFLVSPDGSKLIANYTTDNSPIASDNITSIGFDTQTGSAYIGTNFGITTVKTDALEPNESYSELFVYPNPYELNNATSRQLTIDGLVEDSNIKVLTITGKLVKEFETSGGRIANWNGKDKNGNLVPSGVYIIVAYDQEADKVESTKVAVIRK